MNRQEDRQKKTDKVRSAHISRMAVLLTLFCVCVGGISLVSAKYIKQTVTKNNSATAREFYFESDLLDGQVHEVVPTENGETASVVIRLKNHVDELRYSEVEIAYTVAVTEQNGTASGVTINPSSGRMEAGKAADGQTNDATITLSGLKAGKTYTVTATTDNIYQKSLTGTIRVIQPDTKVYASINDKTQYIEVTVWTTDYAGKVKLMYGNIGLIPDNTDTKMEAALSAGSTLTENSWGANTSHVFRFFKSDANKKYTVSVKDEEVTVSESN